LQASLGVQFRVGSEDTHTNLQSFVHPSVAAPLLLPSSHSSGAVTMPSPQTACAQTPPLQISPVPHDVPASSGVPAEQVWFAWHVDIVLQLLPLLQAVSPRIGSPAMQTHEQLAVHGSFIVPFFDPSSHSSFPSTTPSPHGPLPVSAAGASSPDSTEASPGSAVEEPHPAAKRAPISPNRASHVVFMHRLPKEEGLSP
jgi:hypothetical protein